MNNEMTTRMARVHGGGETRGGRRRDIPVKGITYLIVQVTQNFREKEPFKILKIFLSALGHVAPDLITLRGRAVID